jgi:hypothetical protein
MDNAGYGQTLHDLDDFLLLAGKSMSLNSNPLYFK